MSVQQHNELNNNSETGETVNLMQVYANRYRIYGGQKVFYYKCLYV